MHWLRVSTTLILLCPFGITMSVAQSRPSDEQPIITFVQLTDAHVFDDGWKQPLDTGYRAVGDDWAGLHWAVQEINELVRADEHIDFVVYTGDLGLQNVELEKDCNVAPVGTDLRGLPAIQKHWAVGQLARELNTLAVNTVYFVPGNNDLFKEAVTDSPRHGCFLNLVQSELASFSPPSPVQLKELKAANPVSVNGIRLAGLNSASFKALTNYQRDCPAAGEGCPVSEMASLQTLIRADSREPILVFTHVPDLKDPYRGDRAWDVTPGVRTTWEGLACDSKVLAIFAGHFHDSDRNFYGTTTGTRNLTVSPCVATKTWVAPPLAIKNQNDRKPGARGLLLVEVFKSGMPVVKVYWFDAPVTPSQPKVVCNRTLLWITYSSFAILLLFALFVAMVRRASRDSSPSR